MPRLKLDFETVGQWPPPSLLGSPGIFLLSLAVVVKSAISDGTRPDVTSRTLCQSYRLNRSARPPISCAIISTGRASLNAAARVHCASMIGPCAVIARAIWTSCQLSLRQARCLSRRDPGSDPKALGCDRGCQFSLKVSFFRCRTSSASSD